MARKDWSRRSRLIGFGVRTYNILRLLIRNYINKNIIIQMYLCHYYTYYIAIKESIEATPAIAPRLALHR